MLTGLSSFQPSMSSLVVLETGKNSINQYTKYIQIVKCLQEAISMVQTCSSNGKLESSIMQENFNFNLEEEKLFQHL